MPMYLFQGKYTAAAFQSMVARPQDRTEAVRKAIEAAGGKLHHLFFAFGEHDVVVLMEHQDNASCAAAMMAVAASGALSGGQTTVLMTAAEAQAAMAKGATVAKAYVAPTQG